MKTNSTQPKLKTTPRAQLFSCGFFRQCTQTVLSPTTSAPPPLLHGPPPPPVPPAAQQPESSSSSSSNTSQSFTQWRFPLSSNSPPASRSRPEPEPESEIKRERLPPLTNAALEEIFHSAEIQFGSGSDPERVGAIHLLEHSLVPNPRAAVDGGACTDKVVGGVVACLKDGLSRKAASKVLLALCLAEGNRRVAVEAGAVTAVVEALTDAESAVAERSLAVLELLCTTAEGASEVKVHALAVPMMVEVMGRMDGRGKEHAMSVLAVIYGGLPEDAAVAPREEVARAVRLGLEGECSARGRRKGAQLLKILEEGNGRVDGTQEER